MIETMLSSTVKDLTEDRTMLVHVLEQFPILKGMGSKPIGESAHAASSFAETVQMAQRCGLYILILGGEYGYVESTVGKSATEIEFDTAVAKDPTKVVVFKKHLDDSKINENQRAFIDRVGDYLHGYFYAEYSSLVDLQKLARTTLESWIGGRISSDGHFTYADRFIQYVLRHSPTDDARIYYRTTPETIEIEYHMYGNTRPIHFERTRVQADFWGSVAELLAMFPRWRTEGNSG